MGSTNYIPLCKDPTASAFQGEAEGSRRGRRPPAAAPAAPPGGVREGWGPGTGPAPGQRVTRPEKSQPEVNLGQPGQISGGSCRTSWFAGFLELGHWPNDCPAKPRAWNFLVCWFLRRFIAIVTNRYSSVGGSDWRLGNQSLVLVEKGNWKPPRFTTKPAGSKPPFAGNLTPFSQPEPDVQEMVQKTVETSPFSRRTVPAF